MDPLEGGFQIGGRHVLASRGDQQFFLAVDDLEVAVRVELPDIAGVYPTVLVEGLG